MENTKAKIVMVIAIILLLLCCLGFIIWQSFKIDGKAKVQDKKQEEPIIELDINDELVKTLYGYVSFQNGSYDERLTNYQDKTITVDELDKNFIFECAYRNMAISEEDKLEFLYEDGTSEGKDEWFGIGTELIQQKIKEIFGKTIENESFNFTGVYASYNHGQYNLSFGGGGCGGTQSINKMSKAYKQGNELYIEDKYIFFDSDCVFCSEDEECKDQYVTTLYTSTNKTNKMAQITEVLNVTNIDNSEEILFTKYENIAQRYKHTFKLGEDNKYYWYSTEPIN